MKTKFKRVKRPERNMTINFIKFLSWKEERKISKECV
jgi:hypothetical protein